MNASSLIIPLTLLLAGCGVTGQITGTVTDNEGNPVTNAKVIVWSNPKPWRFFHLAERLSELHSNAEGKFEMVSPKPAHFITASTPNGSGDATLRSIDAQNIRIVISPYPPPDYTHVNKTRRNPAHESFQIIISGSVKHPGTYTITAKTSVWSALLMAGGWDDKAFVRIELVRVSTDGRATTHYPLNWKRRNDEKVSVMLGEGDTILVTSLKSDPTLLAD